jgi:hypothetical protein
MLFVPISNRAKAWLIVLPFGAAILDEGAGWLVRFGHPGFAWAKIGGFLLLQGSLGALIIVALWAVFVGSQRNLNSGLAEEAPELPPPS